MEFSEKLAAEHNHQTVYLFMETLKMCTRCICWTVDEKPERLQSFDGAAKML